MVDPTPTLRSSSDLALIEAQNSRPTLAILPFDDFQLAQRKILGFDAWRDYEDYVAELDGAFIGAACAGEDPRQVQVTLSSFEQWATHANLPFTRENLDRFAALIERSRKRNRLYVQALMRNDAALIHLPRHDQANTVTLSISDALYGDWAGTFADDGLFNVSMAPDIYAHLLVESWLSDIESQDFSKQTA